MKQVQKKLLRGCLTMDPGTLEWRCIFLDKEFEKVCKRTLRENVDEVVEKIGEVIAKHSYKNKAA